MTPWTGWPISGLIHLHLWDIAYRHVKTLGLFGFRLTAAETSSLAYGVLVVEIVGVVLIAFTAWLMTRDARANA